LSNHRFSKYIVVGDRLLIKPKVNSGKTKAGLYLPAGVQDKEQVVSGYVVKSGPGHAIMSDDKSEVWEKHEESVKYIPTQAREGDLALFLRNASHEIEIDGEAHYIVPQNAILLLERDEDLIS
jgi:co-chaperonin GroES (HSP10)